MLCGRCGSLGMLSYLATFAIGYGLAAIVYTMRNPAMMRQSRADFERLTAFVREHGK